MPNSWNWFWGGLVSALPPDRPLPLRWTLRAVQRLEEIGTVIAQDDPAAAQRVLDGIVTRILQLRSMPLLGRVGRCRNKRELVIADWPYIVGYRIHAGEVQILTILHSAQRWPRRL